MDHKIVRTLLLIGAVVLGYGLVMKSKTPVEAIGMIVLVALLLLSMENIKQKKDKIFEMHTHFEAVDEMSRTDFIAYTSHLYKRLGYYIQGIKTEDHLGCDLIISQKDQKIAVYCENQLDPITKDTIQKLYASKNYYHCKQCMVVTNKFLDEEAVLLANANDIKVVNREALAHLMSQVIHSEKQSEPTKESSGSMA